MNGKENRKGWGGAKDKARNEMPVLKQTERESKGKLRERREAGEKQKVQWMVKGEQRERQRESQGQERRTEGEERTGRETGGFLYRAHLNLLCRFLTIPSGSKSLWLRC